MCVEKSENLKSEEDVAEGKGQKLLIESAEESRGEKRDIQKHVHL